MIWSPLFFAWVFVTALVAGFGWALANKIAARVRV
jgi:hypothetical protein